MPSYDVPAQAKGQRLDHYLVRAAAPSGLSRSQLQKLISSGQVTVDGQARPARYSLRGGESVSLTLPAARPQTLEARDLGLSVLHEDADLLVVDKPAGLVTHPGAGHAQDTLVNALLHHLGPGLQAIQGGLRPGIVHRLDKDTTGCLVVAKSEAAFIALQRMIAAREVKRTYLALAWGDLDADEGSIEAPLARGSDRRKMGVRREGGKAALTHFKVRARFGVATELELDLQTGRTHQIRAHLESIGHPVVGDPSYGRRPAHLPAGLGERLERTIQRQALHAWKLQFRHPLSGRQLKFSAPIPEDYAAAKELLSS